MGCHQQSITTMRSTRTATASASRAGALLLAAPTPSTSTSTLARCTCQRRAFSTTPRAAATHIIEHKLKPNDPMDIVNLPDFKYDDVPLAQHYKFEADRERLHLLRIIQFHFPQIKKHAQQYTPPPASSFITVRTQHHLGAPGHPASRKAVLTVPLAELVEHRKLSDASLHKLKLLAGARFDPERNEIKISADRFPSVRMNTKWASDALDRLLHEAEDLTDDMKDIPLDLRHAEIRSIKKGKRRAELAKVPKDWLPAGVTKLP